MNRLFGIESDRPQVWLRQAVALGKKHPALAASPFLGKGIMPGSLRFPEEGGMAVALWDQWRYLLEDMRKVGRVLMITRNALAVLGEYRDFPKLIFSTDENRALGADSYLEYDFRQWAEMLARHESRPQGHLFSLEILDGTKRSLHRICLTPHSKRRLFHRVVRQYQSAGLPRFFRTPETPGQLFFGGLQTDRPCFWEPRSFRGLLQTLVKEKARIEVRVGNAGVVQAASFVPCKITDREDWIYCQGGGTGFHLQWEACHYQSRPAVQAYPSAPWCFEVRSLSGRKVMEVRGTHALPEGGCLKGKGGT